VCGVYRVGIRLDSLINFDDVQITLPNIWGFEDRLNNLGVVFVYRYTIAYLLPASFGDALVWSKYTRISLKAVETVF
jgi:hypothetical protein